MKYFTKKEKGMKAKSIHGNFQNTLGDSFPSHSSVAKWTIEFKFGCESLDDDPLNIQPRCITTPEMIVEAHTILEDC